MTGGGSSAFYADRVDLPFSTISGIGDARVGHAGRFARHWTTGWKSWALLTAFANLPEWRLRQQRDADGNITGPTTDAATGIEGLKVTPWFQRKDTGFDFGFPAAKTRVEDGLNPDGTPGPEMDKLVKAVNDELEELLLAAETERADAMGEILSQANEFMSDFMGLLDISASSHPATFALIDAAVLIGGFAAQHFKQLNDRRRPSQVCPALKPPIDVPGHASYPSGHATQAYLVAELLREAFKDKAQAAAMPAVDALAARIGRNREIAGLHYPSDTRAGEELAKALSRILAKMPQFSSATNLMEVGLKAKGLLVVAQAEWD